jgi:hypothetical protein
MANNFFSGSCILKIPSDKAERAMEVARRVIEVIDSDEDNDIGFNVNIELVDAGIWFHEMECFDAEKVAAIASAVIDDLELEDPFVFSWSYSCSKARVDEFGGGSCAISKGRPPYWIDAYDSARKHFS